MFKATCFLQPRTCPGLLQVVKCWKAGSKSKWHCVLPHSTHPRARSDPIPKNNSNQVKIGNYMAVASHNQTAISYLYILQKWVTFSGLLHLKNDSQFFVTQTHHPIPAPSQTKSGVKTSRHGHVLQEDLRGPAGRPERDGGSLGPSHKMEHIFQWQCLICPSRKLAIMLKLCSSAPRLIYLFFYKWYSPHPRLCFCFIYCI